MSCKEIIIAYEFEATCRQIDDVARGESETSGNRAREKIDHNKEKKCG